MAPWVTQGHAPSTRCFPSGERALALFLLRCPATGTSDAHVLRLLVATADLLSDSVVSHEILQRYDDKPTQYVRLLTSQE